MGQLLSPHRALAHSACISRSLLNSLICKTSSRSHLKLLCTGIFSPILFYISKTSREKRFFYPISLKTNRTNALEMETTEDRKKRLQAMRAKSDQSKNSSNTTPGNEPSGEEKEPVIRFRNYKPYDSSLVEKEKESSTEIVKDLDAPASTKRETDIIKKELAQYNEEELNIVPKKANWDLKSQIEGKLEKLKRKTQRAIVDILREKLAEKSDNEDENDMIKN